MSVLSTINVTRTTARMRIVTAVMMGTDEQLGDLMNVIMLPHDKNCFIVDDNGDNDDMVVRHYLDD